MSLHREEEEDRIPLNTNRVAAVVQRFGDKHWLMEAHILTYVTGPPAFAVLVNRCGAVHKGALVEKSYTKDEEIPALYHSMSEDPANIGANIHRVPHPSDLDFEDWKTGDITWRNPPYHPEEGSRMLGTVIKLVGEEVLDAAFLPIQVHVLFLGR